MNESSTARAFAVLTFEFQREGRLWVGVCRELGVAADGRDILKLADHLADLVELYLSGLEEAGELNNVLRARGVKLYGDTLPASTELPTDEALSTTLLQFKRIPVLTRATAAARD